MLKISLVTFILSVLVCKSLCYEFNDPEFNKILLDDLIEYEALADDELPLQDIADRVRRDVSEVAMIKEKEKESNSNAKEEKCKKPHFGRHNRCCNDGFEKSEEMKALKKECFGEMKKHRKSRKEGDVADNMKDDSTLDVFSCEKVEKNKNNVVCAMECVAKKQGTLTDEGIPDVDKLKEIMKKQYKEDAWQLKHIDDFVDSCLAEVAAKMVMQKMNATTTMTNEQSKCNAGPSIMAHCLWRKIVLNCPEELQDKSQQCQNMREKEQKKQN
ncbi:uncharacterized protein LOC134827008 [Culicoides brevitarsis]|uniref:uncharacterized protein LOC134827008 n=1 Tax=Culicoides brevitarsis TaxID=469753 RepID=UPI00307CA7E1